MKDNNYNYTDPILDNPTLFNSIIHQHENENENACGAWIGYVSTTGVYGNHDGNWVNESSATLCEEGTKARAYLDIERRWMELELQNEYRNVSIFRCAGLYGDRFSALHTVRKKGVVSGSGSGSGSASASASGSELSNSGNGQEALTSRVHLIDVGRAIVAGMGLKREGESESSSKGIFNLVDSLPAARSEVMGYASNLLLNAGISIPSTTKEGSNPNGIAQVPISVSRPLSERRRRRSNDRKKVSNQKMLSDLLHDSDSDSADSGSADSDSDSDSSGLMFPSYREGLKHVMQDNLASWSESS